MKISVFSFDLTPQTPGFQVKAGVMVALLGGAGGLPDAMAHTHMARATTAKEVKYITQRYCTEGSILINAHIAKGTDVCFLQLRPQ